MSEDEGKIAPKQSAFALLMGDDDSDAAGSDSEKEQEEAKPKAQEKAKKVKNILLME